MRGKSPIAAVDGASVRVLVADANLLVAQAVAAAFGGNAMGISLAELGSVELPPHVNVVVVDGDREPEAILTVLRDRLPGAALVLLVSAWSSELLRVADRHGVAAAAVRRDGLPSLLARIRTVMGLGANVTSVVLPTSLGAPAAALTEREHEVGDLMARGLTNDHIASHLGVSVHTVRAHVRNILAKLGVTSRFAAAELLRNHALPAGPRMSSADGLTAGRLS